MGQSYRDLIAWQKAMDFVMDVYRTSKAFPRDEPYATLQPTAKIGGGSSHEHCGGAGAFLRQRVPFFPGTSPGIAGRGRNSTA